MLLLLIGCIILFKQYPCLVIKISGLPNEIENKINYYNENILFIYGPICAECSSGETLYSFRKKDNILFIVPYSLNLNDINNMKELFLLKGEIMYGDNDTESLLKKFAKCLRIDEWKRNYVVKTKRNKKIFDVKQF